MWDMERSGSVMSVLRASVASVTVLVLGLLLTASNASAAAPEKPTLASAQADFAAGQYRPCLQKVAAVLAMPESKRNLPDRYQLFMLRGECLLQLRSPELADDAFHSAATVLKDPADIQKVAIAESTATLVKASSGLKYQPKAPGEPAIDIVDPESRKKAMIALFDDRMAQFKPKVIAANQSTNLVPIHELVPAMTDLYMLELAVSGESKQTLALGKELGGHARDLINGALKQITDRIQDLNMLANEPSTGTLQQIGYRGLTTPERDELRSLANELVKIEEVSTRARQMARQMGGEPAAWDAILADVADAKQLAQKTYDRRY
jgi:hypothetical protein